MSVPASALDAKTQTFPILTHAQIDRLRPYGHGRKVEAGEIVFDIGATVAPFFVMLSGTLEIVQPDLNGERRITTHVPGEFTGEIAMISGQRALVRGRVGEPGEFLEIDSDGLRSVLGREADLSEIFMRAFILRRLALISNNMGLLTLLGSRYSAQTLQIREFLTRNSYPYTFVDLDTDKSSQQLLDRFNVKVEEIPVVICSSANVLRNPTVQKLADRLGFNASIADTKVRDVIIVGAGPSGLAAAVYAASEGLDTLVIESNSPGGQAGSSSKIENYLGFPMGLSGQELAARATAQAQKFGAKMMIARTVTAVDCDRRPYEVILDDGNKLHTRFSHIFGTSFPPTAAPYGRYSQDMTPQKFSELAMSAKRAPDSRSREVKRTSVVETSSIWNMC